MKGIMVNYNGKEVFGPFDNYRSMLQISNKEGHFRVFLSGINDQLKPVVWLSEDLHSLDSLIIRYVNVDEPIVCTDDNDRDKKYLLEYMKLKEKLKK
ncbi:MAG: hypothetical protein J6X57_02115 [Bacteroidales bacterium]|nr:hypothetical protein [Bacteroidales bacterium]